MSSMRFIFLGGVSFQGFFAFDAISSIFIRILFWGMFLSNKISFDVFKSK